MKTKLKKAGGVLASARAFRIHIAGATGPSTIAFEAPATPAKMFIINDTLDVKRVEASATGLDGEFVTVFERKTKKAKPESRADRWNSAASDAKDALERLKEVQDEFESWRDNMSENLQGSPTYDKLDTVCDIDVQSALDAVEEAEGADLPLGFGRD